MAHDVPGDPGDQALEAAASLLAALDEQGLTLATAESLTGGGLGALLTSVPGASSVYVGGVVSYATRLKVALLGVPEELVAEHGVVSGPCAEAMAAGARDRLGADVALSTTGVAGPDEQDGKPAGTVHVGLALPGRVTSVALRLEGDREQVRAATRLAAVRLGVGAFGTSGPGNPDPPREVSAGG